MSIDIFLLPAQLLAKLCQQANPRTLCRLRQTCSFVNNFVEKKRFFINCQCRPQSLWIRLANEDAHPGEVPCHTLVMNHPVNWRYTRDVYEAAIDLSNLQILLNPKLRNTYFQVSAMTFSAVVVDADYYRRQRALSELERNFLVEFIQELRLKCDWLCLYGMSPIDIPLFFPLIRFSNINFTLCDLTAQDLEKWPIEHCEELILFRLCEVPGSVQPLTKRKILFLDFIDCNEADTVFTWFLKEILLNESMKGELKRFRLRANAHNGIAREYNLLTKLSRKIEFLCSFKMFGARIQHSRKVLHYKAYKLPLTDEVAYIFRGMYTIEIHFLKKNCRHDLFAAITSHIFQQRTKVEAPSYFFDDFMKAPNVGMAIKQYTKKLFALRE